MITARHDALIESECRCKGAWGNVLKPFASQELVNSVHRAFNP